MPEKQSGIVDWMNLPHDVQAVSLWAGLHDAQIVSIQSDLLERTLTLHLESDHLLEFHNLPLDMQFLLRLEGVQSTRVVHSAGWPGEFASSCWCYWRRTRSVDCRVRIQVPRGVLELERIGKGAYHRMQTGD
jgi:hypothetical protein